MPNSFLLTFDTEWAPDYVLTPIFDELIARSIKSTWFITHDSPAIRRIIRYKELFEVGIHPNFLPRSSQGANETEILTNLKNIVPDATVVRTHALMQSSHLLHSMAKKFGITTDVSLLLPLTANLVPHVIHYDHDGTALVRIPYFWEDDIEMYDPHKSWEIGNAKYHVPGLKVFDFHPLYVYLNLDSMHTVRTLKQLDKPDRIPKDKLDAYRNTATRGVQQLFRGLLDYITKKQKESFTVTDIVRLWKKSA